MYLSGRTKRLNQGALSTEATIGVKKTNGSTDNMPGKPPSPWQPVRLASKKTSQGLVPVKTVPADKGVFRQVVNPALANLSNVMLPFMTIPNTFNYQSPNNFGPQPVIGQVPQFSGQFPVTASGAFNQDIRAAPNNVHGTRPLIGQAPHLSSQLGVIASGTLNQDISAAPNNVHGSRPLIGQAPHLSGQLGVIASGALSQDISAAPNNVHGTRPFTGQAPHLSGQLGVIASGALSQDISAASNNVHRTRPLIQAPHLSGHFCVVSSGASASSPAVVCMTSGSCRSSPINVEDVSPCGSPSSSSGTDNNYSHAADFVCEVIDEGNSQNLSKSSEQSAVVVRSGDVVMKSYNREVTGDGEMLDVMPVSSQPGVNPTQMPLGSPRRKW